MEDDCNEHHLTLKNQAIIKTTILTLSRLFISLQPCNAQVDVENPKDKIGVSFSSFGENDVYRSEELDGAASYNSDYFFNIGANYIRPINT